jgi:Leucine-rich repeat (LRR) protein
MDNEEGDVYLVREEMTEIPETVFTQGENVKRLYLFENELTSLPSEISRLTNLKYINVSNNRITFIPREIGQLVNLKKIHISGKNRRCVFRDTKSSNSLE